LQNQEYKCRGGWMIFVIYRLLPFWIGIFLIIPIGILSFLLIFYKINEKPFIYYLQAAVNYAISSKLYLWKQRLVKPSDKKEEVAAQPISMIPTVSSDSLKDLAWSLDVQEKEENN
jgi:hypothetical protein